VHDLADTDALLPHMAANVLIADKAFGADDRIIRPLVNAGKSAAMRPRKHRTSLRLRPRPLQGAPSHREFLLQAQIKQFHGIASAMSKPAEISSPRSTSWAAAVRLN
jgi:hypothetical protein